MPDDLRTRIAAVLTTVASGRALSQMTDTDAAVMADAVIGELGLTQQWLVDGIISDGVPRPWEVPCETRWTTEWERFDS